MRFFVKCEPVYFEDETTFYVGPFDSEEDANAYLLMPVDLGRICQRKHTILELYAPTAPNLSLGQTLQLIRDVKYESSLTAAADIARKADPFSMTKQGIPTDSEFVRRHGVENPILTIKELRTRYRGLGLKEAKEIVDEWHANSEATTSLWASASKEANE